MRVRVADAVRDIHIDRPQSVVDAFAILHNPVTVP